MPCDTITTQSVALAKAIPELVAEAMKALGMQIVRENKTCIQARASDWTYTTWMAGKGLTVQGNNNQKHVTEMTKAYSKQAVTWAAKRAGWTVQQTAEDKLTVSRR